MKHIEVNHESLEVTLRKDYFRQEDVDIFRCYGFSWKPGGEITIPIRGTTRKSLLNTMMILFPGFRQTWSKDYLDNIFKEIKQAYDAFEQGFDQAIRDKGLFPKYDKLFAHQKEGVRLQCYKKFTILSFEQGLGKTVTSLIPSILMNTKKTLIIVPASLKFNWVEEMTNVWDIPKNQISVFGSKGNIIADNERYVIINYDMIEKYFEILLARGFTRMIIDECHYIKNRDSKRAKNIKMLRYKLGCSVSFLSGTPSPNKIVDIYSYLEISGHPHGQNFKNFLMNFCFTQETRFGMKVVRGKNIDILNRDMQNILIRKLKVDCLDLPPKNYIKINFESDEYNEQYEQLYNQLIQKILAAPGGKKNIDIQSQLNTLQILTSKAKVKPCIELAENIIDQVTRRRINGKLQEVNKKVIIACNFLDPLYMFEKHFGERCVFIHGGIHSDKRMPLVNRFKTNENVPVMLGQTSCIGVGLNLTECSDIISVNFPYTRAEIEQLLDRAHRIGQESSVTGYFPVLTGKIDDMIYSMIVNKYRDISQLIDNVVDNTETVDVGEEIIDGDLFSQLRDKLLMESAAV